MQQFNAPQVHVITTTATPLRIYFHPKNPTHIFLKKGPVFVFNNVQLCKLNSQEYAVPHPLAYTHAHN